MATHRFVPLPGLDDLHRENRIVVRGVDLHAVDGQDRQAPRLQLDGRGIIRRVHVNAPGQDDFLFPSLLHLVRIPVAPNPSECITRTGIGTYASVCTTC